MDLTKVGLFTGQIEKIKEEITVIKMQIRILNNIQFINIKGDKGASYESFSITADSSFKLNSPSVEVFKTLAIKELTQNQLDKEKELKELIKKGITDND